MSYTPYRLLQLFLEFYHVLICYQYITNPDKTNEKLLVSSIGCTEKNAPGVFQLALMGNSQKALDEQVIKAYHFIQSFAPTDEVTPEEAHQIGMDFMKKTLNQVNVQENTLYDIIYDLFFFAKLQESEDDIKNGKVCTLEELRQHINELEAKYANNNIG